MRVSPDILPRLRLACTLPKVANLTSTISSEEEEEEYFEIRYVTPLCAM